MTIFKTPTGKLRAKRSGQPAAPALTWLLLDETGASVVATAQNLIQAEQVVRKALPPVLAHSCRAANLDRQQITLAVPSAAHATRLRQLTPTLLRALARHGWNLTQIEIRVQAGLGTYGRQNPPREVRPLDQRALACFQELHQNVEPGPLAEAIGRLLTHHGIRER